MTSPRAGSIGVQPRGHPVRVDSCAGHVCPHSAARARLALRAAGAAADALRTLSAGARAHRWVRARCLVPLAPRRPGAAPPVCGCRLARFVPLLGARTETGAICAWCAPGVGRPGESHGICQRHVGIMRRVGAVRRVET